MQTSLSCGASATAISGQPRQPAENLTPAEPFLLEHAARRRVAILDQRAREQLGYVDIPVRRGAGRWGRSAPPSSADVGVSCPASTELVLAELQPHRRLPTQRLPMAPGDALTAESCADVLAEPPQPPAGDPHASLPRANKQRRSTPRAQIQTLQAATKPHTTVVNGFRARPSGVRIFVNRRRARRARRGARVLSSVSGDTQPKALRPRRRAFGDCYYRRPAERLKKTRSTQGAPPESFQQRLLGAWAAHQRLKNPVVMSAAEEAGNALVLRMDATTGSRLGTTRLVGLTPTIAQIFSNRSAATSRSTRARWRSIRRWWRHPSAASQARAAGAGARLLDALALDVGAQFVASLCKNRCSCAQPSAGRQAHPCKASTEQRELKQAAAAASTRRSGRGPGLVSFPRPPQHRLGSGPAASGAPPRRHQPRPRAGGRPRPGLSLRTPRRFRLERLDRGLALGVPRHLGVLPLGTRAPLGERLGGLLVHQAGPPPP